MIRPFTLVCMLLACGSGLYLYQAKHRVLMLDRQISATVQATTLARDRAGMLRTEWALLNDPERLRALADQHLQLRPMAPGQLVSLAELGSRLPPPREAAAEPEPESPVTARQEPVTTPSVPAAMAPSITVAKAPSITAAKAATRTVAEAASRTAEHKPAPVRMAAQSPGPMRPATATPPIRTASPGVATGTTSPGVPTGTTSSSVPMRVMASIAPTPAVSKPAYVPPIPRELIVQIAHGRPAGAPLPMARLPMMASALGMARTLLPPPVPVAGTSAMSRDGN